MHVAPGNIDTNAQQKANCQVAIDCYPMLQNAAKSLEFFTICRANFDKQDQAAT
jgi:hypothetical protein